MGIYNSIFVFNFEFIDTLSHENKILYFKRKKIIRVRLFEYQLRHQFRMELIGCQTLNQFNSMYASGVRINDQTIKLLS